MLGWLLIGFAFAWFVGFPIWYKHTDYADPDHPMWSDRRRMHKQAAEILRTRE